MNEEEKKAIESFKDDLNRCKNELILCRQGLLDLKTILNLIEKLQKENEELKLYNNSITSQLEQMTTKKFKEGWIHQSEFKDFIPVQKVKDKIEELKQKKKKYGNCLIKMYEDELVNRDIKILQELLEGRK